MPTSFAVLFDAEFEQEEAERLERVRAKARTLLEEGRRRAEIEVRHVDDLPLIGAATLTFLPGELQSIEMLMARVDMAREPG